MVLLRLLLQWSRADFRNPLCQAIVHLTNPLIVPLRRVLPPIGKIDTASVRRGAPGRASSRCGASGCSRTAGLPPLTRCGCARRCIEIARTLLWTYFYAILLYALLSLIAPGSYSPLQSVLASLCEPVLRPFRRLIPPLGGIDLSPLWAGISSRPC